MKLFCSLFVSSFGLECLNLDQSSFSSTTINHKFNHHGYESGYEITGDFFGDIKATEGEYDGPDSRSIGDSWIIGKYRDTTNWVGSKNVLHYWKGSYCHPTGKDRETTITFTCGDKFEITKMTEPSTCVYEIEATKPCVTKKHPSIRLTKLGQLFNEYRGLWFTHTPNFSDRMQRKVELLGQKMLDFLEKHKARINLCGDHGVEDPETTRYDRSDACKGAAQLTTGYIKWAEAYNIVHRYAPHKAMYDRVKSKFGRIRDKLRYRYACD